MSSFTSPLVVSPMTNGKDWKLQRNFTYHIGNKRSQKFISVKTGFVTDFASVPRVFFFLPDWATYSKAPILHDYLYFTHTIMGKSISRKRADDLFLEAMLVDWRNHKSRMWVAYLEYLAVRLFGWLMWNKKGDANA